MHNNEYSLLSLFTIHYYIPIISYLLDARFTGDCKGAYKANFACCSVSNKCNEGAGNKIENRNITLKLFY